MKTAIVCDWLVTFAGSERFLEELITCFPNADLFAVVDFLPKESRKILQDKSVTTTFIQRLPFAKKWYRHYLPLMPLAIEQLNLSDYELIISSSHAIAKGVITGPDQIHCSYVHSPMRYAWDLQHQYLQESGLQRGLKSLIARYFLHKMRLWDQRTAHGVDHFAANSNYIARRIWKTYRRTAEVIYPPVNLSLFTPSGKQKENFYLAASRMVPYKKMDLIVESFSALSDKKLIVVGDGPQLKKVKAKANNNIEILGYQSTEVLIDLMQRAKAFVFAAEEDFGLLPLEAQACGTPVIAFAKGGALETVVENKTGIFFQEQSTASLTKAIREFEHSQIHSEECVAQAARFKPAIFREKFSEWIKAAIKQK